MQKGISKTQVLLFIAYFGGFHSLFLIQSVSKKPNIIHQALKIKTSAEVYALAT